MLSLQHVHQLRGTASLPWSHDVLRQRQDQLINITVVVRGVSQFGHNTPHLNSNCKVFAPGSSAFFIFLLTCCEVFVHVGTRVEADSMVAQCVQSVCLVATTAVRRPTHCNIALVDQLTSRWDYEVVVAFFGAHDECL